MNKRNRHIPLSELALENEDEAGIRICDHPACQEVGAYRAPRSKQELDVYLWFCLEHVRAYNAAWDFFRGMSQSEIERFQRDAVTGHRPTWRMGSGFGRAAMNGIKDPFGLFSGSADGGPEVEADGRPIDPKRRRALAVMNLEPGANLQEIKMRYKQLVKRYHPDANGGDKAAEERFKSISEAYTFLLSTRAA